MKDSNQLLNQVAQEIAQSQSNSTTAAGPSKGDSHKRRQQDQKAPSADFIDAINQVFELFRINYHNQYFAAFGDIQTLNQAKRLWLETLQRFEPKVILHGAKLAIEQSEYLPTLHKMIGFCQGSPQQHGLPDVHSAYIEACRAPSPKTEFKWSHAAVYHAGRNSDWFFLANNSERIAFPIFKDHYLSLCQRVINGDTLPTPEVKRLPESIEKPLTKEENIDRLTDLRKEMGL